MFIPIVIIPVLVFAIIFAVKSSNKNREQQYAILIENIKDEIELYVEQTKSLNITIGLNNSDFLFNHCDLYVIKNAIIILGFTKNSFFKQLSTPIILTHELNKFSSRFPFARVKKPNKVNFENDVLKINFGEKGITKTEVILKLTSLNKNEINKIKEIAQKNNWNTNLKTILQERIS
ncbi:hypothetical protein [Flavobacterium sp. GSA192]|uniref:hypothetical protein n=1 Tax=Flavobacterium sp. GSA192 TaxID=2576304 RepID=UPI001127D8CB|nr:hypothetical protein [Flavobacterium sp. GSA192]